MLTFDTKLVGHGCLWVSIQAASFWCEFPASNVPYDSISQLVDALVYLLAYQGLVVVRWNSEPVEHEFRFTRAGDLVHLEVIEFPDGGRSASAGQKIGFVSGPLNQLLQPFVQALQQVEQDKGFRAEWDRPFPAALLERVTQALAQRTVSKGG